MYIRHQYFEIESINIYILDYIFSKPGSKSHYLAFPCSSTIKSVIRTTLQADTDTKLHHMFS